jgi:hypothetical protein
MTTKLTTEQAALRTLVAHRIVIDAISSLPAQARRLNAVVLSGEDVTVENTIADTLAFLSNDLVRGEASRSRHAADEPHEKAAVAQLRAVAEAVAFVAGRLGRAADELDGISAGLQAQQSEAVEQIDESADEECPHEFHMGTCIGCGVDAADDFDEAHYNPGPRKLSPSEVIGTDDLNLLSELVAEATESLERKARNDSFEASYLRHRIKVYRELLDRVCR